MNHPLFRVLAACSLTAVACGGSPGPTPTPTPTPPAPVAGDADPEPDPAAICGRVADQVIGVMTTEIEQDLAAMAPEQADKIRAELAASMSKSELVGKCLGDPPSAEEFLCITNAATVRELIACDRAQRPTVSRETCVTVADHILPILVAEEQLFAGESEEVRSQKSAGLSQELVTACLARDFTAAEIECILAATSLQGVSGCEQPDPTAPQP